MKDAQHGPETFELSRVRRRTLLGALCASACTTILPLARTHGQARALPLKNLGLEHVDIVVPDPAESARFYKRVFSSPLHEQDFRGAKRYFVLLGRLPPDRQVGYIAVGAANGWPVRTSCVSASRWRRSTARRSRRFCERPAPRCSQ